MKQYGIGQPIPRFEDLVCSGAAVDPADDRNLPGQSYGVVLRSPHAHARIVSIDTAAARAAPGCSGRLYGEGLCGRRPRNAEATTLAQTDCFTDVRSTAAGSRRGPSSLCVGDPVVSVVAESLAEAKDAAELIVVDYEPRRRRSRTRRLSSPVRRRFGMNTFGQYFQHRREAKQVRHGRRRSRAPYAPYQAAVCDHLGPRTVHGDARSAWRLRRR